MRKLIPVLVVLALIAACKNESNSGVAGLASGSADARAAQNMAAVSTLQAAPPPPPPPPQAPSTGLPKMIVRNANIAMTVDDTAATLDKITSAAESVGGYVSDSRVWRDGEQMRASVSLRIPADRLTAALGVIRKLAVRINSETIGSQEVTQEYVDLESQLKNLEAAEVELRALMTTIRQNSKKASEVLEMYQQLANIRAQIEQVKGRMRYLSQLAALATVQIDLVPNALAKPVVEPGWQPLVIVKNASRSLVEALQTFAAMVIWLGIYVVPMFAIIGIIVYGSWRVITMVWKPRRLPIS